MYNYNYHEAYLEHHGVKGQKWGVRRYQNYDGTLIGAKRRNKARTDLGSRLKRIRAERAKKAAAKAKQKEVKKQESFEEAKAKAIATGDVKKILEMRGQLTTAELKEAASRQQALMQLNQWQLPKEKSALEKIVAKLDKAKTTMDSVKNFHKSATELRDELFGGKKKDKNQQNQNQNEGKKKKNKENQQSQQQNQNKGSDSFDKLAALIAKKLNDAPSKQQQNNNQPKEKKPKGIDIEEGPDWSNPFSSKRSSDSSSGFLKINPSNVKRDENAITQRILKKNYSEGLSRIGQIFKDTSSGSSTRGIDMTKNELSDRRVNSIFDSISKVTKQHAVEEASIKFHNATKLVNDNREKTLGQVEIRNKSGFTATNNGTWLGVLEKASELHVSEGNIWKERYGDI